MIQSDFLSYEGETPEKEFCKADRKMQREFMKLGIVLTTSINNNIEAEDIYNAMQDIKPPEKRYSSFDQLFEDASRNGAVGDFANQQLYLISRSRYNFEFNIWLQDTKDWEYGNELQYEQLLTKLNFMQFLQYEKQLRAEKQKIFENERQSWQLNELRPVENNLVKSIMERTELHNFLSVPTDDLLHKNAFWHGTDDLPIDCNIYHPKYGYKGFESSENQIVVTSFQPVVIYKDDSGGKYVYCQYCWQILCTPDELSFSNKDGKTVIKVDFLQQNQTRLAESEQDFEWIFKREFESKSLKGSTEIARVFTEQLSIHVEDLVQQHIKHSSYRQGRDINLLGAAYQFIDYLKLRDTKTQIDGFVQIETGSNSLVARENPQPDITGPVFALFCSIVHQCGCDEIGFDESKEAYCRRISTLFSIPINPQKARQAFFPVMDIKSGDPKLQKIRDFILPNIPAEVGLKIQAFLNHKTKMYG